jgi:hypothetical protein
MKIRNLKNKNRNHQKRTNIENQMDMTMNVVPTLDTETNVHQKNPKMNNNNNNNNNNGGDIFEFIQSIIKNVQFNHSLTFILLLGFYIIPQCFKAVIKNTSLIFISLIVTGAIGCLLYKTLGLSQAYFKPQIPVPIPISITSLLSQKKYSYNYAQQLIYTCSNTLFRFYAFYLLGLIEIFNSDDSATLFTRNKNWGNLMCLFISTYWMIRSYFSLQIESVLTHEMQNWIFSRNTRRIDQNEKNEYIRKIRIIDDHRSKLYHTTNSITTLESVYFLFRLLVLTLSLSSTMSAWLELIISVVLTGNYLEHLYSLYTTNSIKNDDEDKKEFIAISFNDINSFSKGLGKFLIISCLHIIIQIFTRPLNSNNDSEDGMNLNFPISILACNLIFGILSHIFYNNKNDIENDNNEAVLDKIYYFSSYLILIGAQPIFYVSTNNLFYVMMVTTYIINLCYSLIQCRFITDNIQRIQNGLNWLKRIFNK